MAKTPPSDYRKPVAPEKTVESERTFALPPGPKHKAKTVLAQYLNVSHVSKRSMARALGVGVATCDNWIQGTVQPSIAAAYEIERITKGCVPIEAWLACPSAKRTLAEMRRKQPDALREKAPEHEVGGGFAKPTSLQDSKLDRKRGPTINPKGPKKRVEEDIDQNIEEDLDGLNEETDDE